MSRSKSCLEAPNGAVSNFDQPRIHGFLTDCGLTPTESWARETPVIARSPRQATGPDESPCDFHVEPVPRTLPPLLASSFGLVPCSPARMYLQGSSVAP